MALVQKKAGAEVGPSTTHAATFDSAVTAGNLVVGVAAVWDSTAPALTSIADNKGNGNYTIQESDAWASQIRHAQGSKEGAGLTTGGTSFTVTATFDAGVAGAMGIIEYAGVAANPTVTSISNSGTSAAPNSGTLAPAAASVVVASMATALSGGTFAVNDVNYVEQLELDQDNSHQAQNIADRFDTVGSQSCTWSQSGSSAWGAHAVAYSLIPSGESSVMGKYFSKGSRPRPFAPGLAR